MIKRLLRPTMIGITKKMVLRSNNIYLFAKSSKKDAARQEHLKKRTETSIPTQIDFTKLNAALSDLKTEFEEEIKGFKIGKLTPETFKDIYVNLGNQTSPISQIGNVIPINANTVSISLYDDTIQHIVYKVLEKDELNEFTLKLDDQKIIATIENANTKEKKTKLVRLLKDKSEKVKKLMKEERANNIKEIEKLEKFVGKDVVKNAINETTKIHKKFSDGIDQSVKNKEKELNS